MSDIVQKLRLPNTTVLKLIKRHVPTKVCVSKDAKCTLNRIAVVLIMYVTNAANQHTKHCKRKIVNEFDILEAFRELKLANITELKTILEKYSKLQLRKTKKRSIKKKDVEEVPPEEETLWTTIE